MMKMQYYLNNFLTWLDIWKECNVPLGSLSKETHFALKHSTYALIEMGKYIINELKKKYFLPGVAQTDPLEARFGKYRQLSGSQYCISIRQLYECEAKLRIQNFITLSSSKYGSITVDNFEIECNEEFDFAADSISNMIDTYFPQVFVSDRDIENCKDVLPIIAYLGGYCVYSALKKSQCEFCKSCVTLNRELAQNSTFKLISDLDRGKLKFPHPDIVNAVTYTYVVVKKLMSEPLEEMFLKYFKQRELACKLTLTLLTECDLELDSCSAGHPIKNIINLVVWKSTNALLKNYCKKRNDHLTTIRKEQCSKKRKLETFNR